jgi:hypothetical protein
MKKKQYEDENITLNENIWVIFCRTPWQLGSNTAYDPEGLVFDNRNRIHLLKDNAIIPWKSQLRVNGMLKRKKKRRYPIVENDRKSPKRRLSS